VRRVPPRSRSSRGSSVRCSMTKCSPRWSELAGLPMPNRWQGRCERSEPPADPSIDRHWRATDRPGSSAAPRLHLAVEPRPGRLVRDVAAQRRQPLGYAR
jgi:hypothetical protein